MPAKWLLAALATLALWGVWGVLVKKASIGLRWHEVYIGSNLVGLVMVALLAYYYGVEGLVSCRGCLVTALAAGVCGAVGYVFMIYSLKAGGKASVVITLTALYPLVTVILSRLLFGEELTARKVAGIALALAAIALLSSEEGGE